MYQIYWSIYKWYMNFNQRLNSKYIKYICYAPGRRVACTCRDGGQRREPCRRSSPRQRPCLGVFKDVESWSKLTDTKKKSMDLEYGAQATSPDWELRSKVKRGLLKVERWCEEISAGYLIHPSSTFINCHQTLVIIKIITTTIINVVVTCNPSPKS